MKPPGVLFEARPRRARRVAVAAAVVLIVVFAVVAALLRETPTGVYFQLSDQVAMVLVGLLLAGAALLFARPRVRAGAEGVEVRNLLGNRTVPWELILRVSFPDGAPWARLELPDDEYIAVMAIQATDGRHAVQAIRRLRAVHAEHTTPREAPGSDHLSAEYFWSWSPHRARRRLASANGSASQPPRSGH